MIDQRETLATLADRVQRLRPDHRDPERYHAEKSEIAAELRRLACISDTAQKIISHSIERIRTV